MPRWPRTRSWLRKWGPAEFFGSLGALAGFILGWHAEYHRYSASGSTVLIEAGAFYGTYAVTATRARWVPDRTRAWWRKTRAAAWQAVREQFTSCLVAELIDDLAVRPSAFWLFPLASHWLGFWGLVAGWLVAKAVSDLSWYRIEALTARWAPRLRLARARVRA